MLTGGDTIRQINQMSNAKVELQRNPGANPNEKIFNIRGSDRNQVQHAIQLICERAGLVSTVLMVIPLFVDNIRHTIRAYLLLLICECRMCATL